MPASTTSTLQPTPQPTDPLPWSTSQRLFRCTLLLIVALNLLPIWLVDYPGMVDYPNHLVRCYILAHIHTNPAFAAHYLLVADPTPNLAIEAIVVPLNHLLPILTSGKIFLSLALLLYIAGCLSVGRAITGKPSWLALALAFTFFNSNVFYGFVNYVFGVGVFLCIFALWLRSRATMPWTRFALLCPLSLVAFLAHLSSIAFLAIACITVAALDFRSDRSAALLLRRLAWLLCPAILLLRFMHGNGHVGTIEWSTLTQKAIHLFTPIRSYSLPLDALLSAVAVLLVILLIRTGRLHRIAFVSAVFLLLYLATPHTLFTSMEADARFIIPAFLIFMLSIQPTWNRRETTLFVLFLALLVVRSLEVDRVWRIINQREAHVLQMGDLLPTGAQVLAVDNPNPDLSTKLDRGFPHVITLWTVTRGAYVSSLFTFPGQQPLVLRNPACQDAASPACILQYDYVWTHWSDPIQNAAIQSLATPAAQWDTVTLWKVRHQPARLSPSESAKINQ